jgi:hypothetical protein
VNLSCMRNDVHNPSRVVLFFAAEVPIHLFSTTHVGCAHVGSKIGRPSAEDCASHCDVVVENYMQGHMSACAVLLKSRKPSISCNSSPKMFRLECFVLYLQEVSVPH